MNEEQESPEAGVSHVFLNTQGTQHIGGLQTGTGTGTATADRQILQTNNEQDFSIDRPLLLCACLSTHRSRVSTKYSCNT